MSRMRDALQVLADRRQSPVEAPLPLGPVVAIETPLPVAVAPIAKPTPQLAKPAPQLARPIPLLPENVLSVTHPAAKRVKVQEVCSLPTALELADHYLDTAESISDQLATNYCNVMLFASPEPLLDGVFSITHAAQAFAEFTEGDVLLVDGDLRRGELSQIVRPSASGLIEAMQGAATWPEIIHPTTAPRIDFVARGHGPIPTLERNEFGWGALRPKYRSVLIGVSVVQDPETAWLASRCDAVYLIVSRHHTRRPQAIIAVNALRAAGASVMGCIVADD